MDFTLLLPVLVTAVGLFLLIRLRFFFILHPIRTIIEFVREFKNRDAGRSFFLALAGTLGVGNIFGVSAGIMIGGAGSLFWLFVSSLFAMVIKYSETLLVFDSKIDRGGMAVLLKRTFHSIGWLLSPIYAIMMLVLSLFMGGAMQSLAVFDVAEQSLSVHPIVSAIILMILLLPCFTHGVRKIEQITEIIIPLTTIIYILMCFMVIFVNYTKIYDVINMIISSAFSFKSALGGISLVALREGFARGILSNEAGVGTSAMAHSVSGNRSPHAAGLFAMCEVVFDSSVLCMLTGFAILVSVPNISDFSTPMALVSAAFDSCLGGISRWLLPAVILAFAYATMICWYFYGRECSALLFPRLQWVFPFLFIAFVLTSRIIRSENLLYVIDILLLFMSFLTLSVIIKSIPRIEKLSRDALRINK
ncbi:MAG: alanine:cation symporter family protein [Clostridia bacterium]|nr:alanine:cation symporter family protein [Clostridia bacterium]